MMTGSIASSAPAMSRPYSTTCWPMKSARPAGSVDALPSLTQDDINDGVSTTYEVELAVVDLAAGTLLRSLGAASQAGLAPDQLRHIFVSTQDPTADDGEDGDIWIKVGS